MLRWTSQIIALLGLALLVLHHFRFTSALGDLPLYYIAGFMMAFGVAGLLIYGASGYTSQRRIRKIDPR